MRNLKLMTILAMSGILLIAVSANAAEWYIVKHKAGETVVIDYAPGGDWTIIGGPYESKEAAARAGNIDPGATSSKPVPKFSAEGDIELWFVVKHKAGETTVVNYKPGGDWSIIGGPYESKEAAARAGNIDPSKQASIPVPEYMADRGEGEWYVVKHKAGETVVIDYKPGGDWSIVSGPHKTKSAAARAGNIDPTKQASTPVPKFSE
jgi:hypothetical protein